MNIPLCPETINAYKELITNPQKHGLDITPITDFFIESTVVIPKHLLAKAYIEHINKPLPKVILYIIMDEIYGCCREKDDNGDLGYKLIVNNKQDGKSKD